VSGVLGRSVRLFLVDGKSTGLITAEIMNWTGHVLTGPRSQLPRILSRPEVARTGIYLLYGRDPDDPDTLRLYIGESDNVGNRLKQHNQDQRKAYWERTCVVTSKDQNITKAHARYLESRLIAIAHAAGHAKLDNGTVPPPIALPEADVSDMEYFIDQMRLVLPVLGLEILRESPKPSSEPQRPAAGTVTQVSPVFELSQRKTGVHARAQEIDGDFVVLKGSTFVPQWKQADSVDLGYGKLHAQLRQNGKLALEPGQLLAVLTEDCAFSSPSAASAVVLGRRDNGRLSWKLEGAQTTYAAWQEREIQAAEGSERHGGAVAGAIVEEPCL